MTARLPVTAAVLALALPGAAPATSAPPTSAPSVSAAASANCCEFWWIVCRAIHGPEDVRCDGWYDAASPAGIRTGRFVAEYVVFPAGSCTFNAVGSFFLDGQLADTFSMTVAGPSGMVSTGRGGFGTVAIRPAGVPDAGCAGDVEITGVVTTP